MATDPYILFEKAEKKRASSRFLEAIPLYLTSKKLAKDTGLKTACHFSLGDVYRMVGDFERSIRSYRAAHDLAVKSKDVRLALDSMVGQGLALRATGNFKEAIPLFDKSLRWYRLHDDTEGVAFTLWARAGAYRIKGDLASALKGFKESQKIFARMRDKSGVGYCFTGLGGASRVAGRPLDSYKYYIEANRIFRTFKDTFGTAYSYCGVANSMRMRDDFKGSLAYFRKAKTNYRKIGDKVSYAYTLWGEGSAYQMLGKNSLAAKDFREAEKLFKITKDRRGLVYCLLSVSQIEFAKDPKKGIRLAKEALRKALSLNLGVEIRYAKKVLETMSKHPEKLPLNLA